MCGLELLNNEFKKINSKILYVYQHSHFYFQKINLLAIQNSVQNLLLNTIIAIKPNFYVKYVKVIEVHSHYISFNLIWNVSIEVQKSIIIDLLHTKWVPSRKFKSKYTLPVPLFGTSLNCLFCRFKNKKFVLFCWTLYGRSYSVVNKRLGRTATRYATSSHEMEIFQMGS